MLDENDGKMWQSFTQFLSMTAKRTLRVLMVYWRFIFAIAVPLVLLPLPLVSGTQESLAAFSMLLMAIYWMFEVLPLAVTSLMPVAMFPLMGIMSTGEVTVAYMTATGMLFIGSLILAQAIEECNLHRRIALYAMRISGTSPRFLLLGFMLPTAFLSMWISNTATTVLMIPTMEAVVAELREYDERAERSEQEDPEAGNDANEVEPLQSAAKTARTRSAMLAMAICIAANVGGNATIIGSSINIVLIENLDVFGNHPLTFAAWMGFTIPSVILNLFVIWCWLQIYYLGLPDCMKRKKNRGRSMKDSSKAVEVLLRQKCKELGKMSYQEWSVTVVFVIVALLWFFRSPGFMTGWGDLIENSSVGGISVADATPTILMCLLLFLLPAKPNFMDVFNKKVEPENFKSSPSLIDWKSVESQLPWGIILLMGGGFALAEAMEVTCLSDWIGQQLLVLDSLPPWALSTVLSLIAWMLTQFVQNTATASMLLPVYRTLAISTRINPLYLMYPPTLVVSYSFLLPISSAPNAIVYRASGMSLWQMAKVGSVASLLCVLVTLVCINTYGYVMFDLGEYPDWAESYQEQNGTNRCL